MIFGWAASQNPVSEGLASEVPAVQLYHTSKTYDMLILTTVVTNNQPAPHLIGGDNIWEFSLNDVDLGLVIEQVYAKSFTLTH